MGKGKGFCFLKKFLPLFICLEQDDGTKTLVMPLQNGTQKDVGLGPDFRRDDGKSRDDDKGRDGRWVGSELYYYLQQGV